jgi:hypothetical protein
MTEQGQRKVEARAEIRAYRSVLDNLCRAEMSRGGREWVIQQITLKDNELSNIESASTERDNVRN